MRSTDWRDRSDDPPDDGVWHGGEGDTDSAFVDGLGIVIYDEGGHTPEQAEHIARWDPARVLAEVAAKRAIIDLHVGEHECVGDRHGTLGTVLVAEGYIHELCPTVLALAQPYAEHPDFDPAWRLT